MMYKPTLSLMALEKHMNSARAGILRAVSKMSHDIEGDPPREVGRYVSPYPVVT
jgi:hypothetical protein